MSIASYTGRFAPSPTGPLHTGSLVSAMASYLDAKIHAGKWLVRIEDIDELRTVVGAAESILQSLLAFGMQWDGSVVWQSQRHHLYQNAFNQLTNHTYPCGCTRREITDSRISTASDGAAIYPGTCRAGLASSRAAHTFRLQVPEPGQENETIHFNDAWMGSIVQHLAMEVGDFVLKRAEGYWAYQLAVVVDDAAQGVTDVVRGKDLLDSTGRQIYLQRLLKLSSLNYLHVPVVVNLEGEKLSKQTGARAVDLTRPLDMLLDAANFLGLTLSQRPGSIDAFWHEALPAWANLRNNLNNSSPDSNCH